MTEAATSDAQGAGTKVPALNLNQRCGVCGGTLSAKLTKDEAGNITASYRCRNTDAHARLATNAAASASETVVATRPPPVIHYRRIQLSQ